MKPVVTLVTSAAASADELSDTDYREIYDELRSKATLRQFAEFIKSKVSFAWWSKFERGSAHLDRERRQELRRAVGLAPLPPTVTEATETVSPNAMVWRVGNGTPDRVVLMFGEEAHEPITFRLNGSLQIVDEECVQSSVVTGVTRPRDRSSYAGLSVRRETRKRLNAARVRSGQTWDEFLSYWTSLLEDPEDLEE
jgi:hypothetical protein